MAWMEKLIGEHGKNPVPVIPFPNLVSEAGQKINN